jgi:hypothetical protein
MMGYTALMFASERGHENIAKLLIENGANVEQYNYLRNTALMLASENGHERLLTSLIENGAKDDKKFGMMNYIFTYIILCSQVNRWSNVHLRKTGCKHYSLMKNQDLFYFFYKKINDERQNWIMKC